MSSTICVNASFKEDLPDLIINDINIHLDQPIPWADYILICTISNIGDSHTEDGFDLEVKVNRLILGIIPYASSHEMNFLPFKKI